MKHYPPPGPTFTVAPGTNRAAAVQTALNRAGALATATRKITVQLLAGNYYLEDPLDVPNYVCLRGDALGRTRLIATHDGDPDTATNAIVRAVGVLDEANLNTTLGALVQKGASSLT